MTGALHVHSHFSILEGLPQIEHLVEHAKQHHYQFCALTDRDNVAGVISFAKQMKEAGIKPIVGCELTMHEDNQEIGTVCVLAKNKQGWSEIVKLVSIAHAKDSKLTFAHLDEIAHNLILFTGSQWSTLGFVYQNFGQERFQELLEVLKKLKARYAPDFAIELVYDDNFPATISLREDLIKAARQLKIPAFASTNAYYCKPEDAPDHRLLIATKLNCKLSEVSQKATSSQHQAFFSCSSYCLPTEEFGREISPQHTKNMAAIADKCEAIDFFHAPRIPSFTDRPDEMLLEECRKGWKKRGLPPTAPYIDSVKHELDVIKRAGLSNYFLIVQDFVKYAKETLCCLVGEGRGSAAGCIVSYLMEITDVDPVQYGLFFSRFYNEGRNDGDHISLPDIDMDFPVERREDIIQYIQNKYGNKQVAQMATYARMWGRGALKDVMRAHGRATFEEINRMTKPIPGREEISDQLHNMDKPSIIRWVLENNPKAFSDWCSLTEDGTLEGELAPLFEQAIRLEGTVRSRGRHAAGIIIADADISEIAPIIYDSASRHNVVGLDMKDCEFVGLVKFDILGTAVLDRIELAVEHIRNGDFAD